MPTTLPRSVESNDIRPPCRTEAVTGVPSANSGHYSIIPITVSTLWEPAAPCADVPGAAPATVLPTPRTSSATEPSIGMGATLECGPGFDRSKTPACRTLGAPPPHAWRTVPSTATATTPTEAIRTLARSPQDQGRRSGQLPRPALCPPLDHSVLSTVVIHCAPSIWGGDDDSRSPRTCTPPLHVSIKGGDGPLIRTDDLTCSDAQLIP